MGDDRTKETAEFLQSLKSGDTLVKPVYNPEAWVLRDKYRAAADRGDLKKTECRHPIVAIQQYQDHDPTVKRRDKDLNLFMCSMCGMHLWLVDPWGTPISDV